MANKDKGKKEVKKAKSVKVKKEKKGGKRVDNMSAATPVMVEKSDA